MCTSIVDIYHRTDSSSRWRFLPNIYRSPSEWKRRTNHWKLAVSVKTKHEILRRRYRGINETQCRCTSPRLPVVSGVRDHDDSNVSGAKQEIHKPTLSYTSLRQIRCFWQSLRMMSHHPFYYMARAHFFFLTWACIIMWESRRDFFKHVLLGYFLELSAIGHKGCTYLADFFMQC